MKKLTFTLLITLLTTMASGQNATSFYKVFTGGPFDQAHGAVQLPDSSYVITGSSSSFSNGTSQAFLFTIDSLGNRIATASFGGSGSDLGRRVFYQEGEGFTVLGYSNSNPDGNGDFDFSYYRTNINGTLLDTKYYGNEDWERLWDAKQINDGGFILVGESEGVNSIQKDMFMVRIDAVGDTIWTKKIQTNGDDVAYALTMLSDTTFAVVGKADKAGVNHAVLLVFHIDGPIIWEKTFDEGDGRGELYAIDLFNNEIFVGGGFIRNGKQDFDHWNVKLNLQGDIIGEDISNWSEDDYTTNILVTGQDKLYWTLSSVSPDQGVYIGGTDLFFLRFHTDMYFLGPSQSFSGVNDDVCNQMIATNDGGFLLVGYASDDRVNLSLGTDILVIKIGPNDEITPVENLDNPFLSVNENILFSTPLYPNPATTHMHIPTALIGSEYVVYSPEGKLQTTGILQTKLDVTHLATGSYLLQIRTPEGIGYLRFYKL